VLFNDLIKTLPQPIEELTCDLEELMSQIQDELRPYSLLGLNSTEIDNAMSSLSDRAQLLLQQLHDKNEELSESKKVYGCSLF
jgi:hypothetical protein